MPLIPAWMIWMGSKFVYTLYIASFRITATQLTGNIRRNLIDHKDQLWGLLGHSYMQNYKQMAGWCLGKLLSNHCGGKQSWVCNSSDLPKHTVVDHEAFHPSPGSPIWTFSHHRHQRVLVSVAISISNGGVPAGSWQLLSVRARTSPILLVTYIPSYFSSLLF